MTRLEANLKIAEILRTKGYIELGNELEKYAKYYPQQRAGQILCNYIYPEYRFRTVPMLQELFPNNPDPFFEESEDTLKRYGRE